MRAFRILLFTSALSAIAQVATLGQTPVPQQPLWMDVFKKVYSPQGQGAALGSLDQEIEKSWAAALAAGPQHPFFETAAQQTAQYFASQGYERKAETTLRQAIATAKQSEGEVADRSMSRSFRLALAQRFTQEQRLVAAAALIQEILQETKAGADPARLPVLMQLAQLREQMGEMETAEALLREARTLQSAPQAASVPQGVSTLGQNRRMAYPGPIGVVTGNFSRGYAGAFSGSGDLASFYQRQGETVNAEALYQKDLDEARAPEEVVRARQRYAHFLNSQQRWDDSVGQWEKLLQMQAASSRPEDRQMLAGSRVNLAQALMAAGKPDKALELLQDHIVQSGSDANQRAEALRFYANILMQQKKFEEAEKVVEQIRHPVGKDAEEMSKRADSIADHLLADIRQMQNRGEEARALREKTMGQMTRTQVAGAPFPIWNLIQPVQELMGRRKYDEAMVLLQRILVDATPRIHSNPEEIAAFTNLVNSLPQGRREERLQLMQAILATLDGVHPADHPRIAQALSQFLAGSVEAGLSPAEITRLMEREEKILRSSKGDDSLALNSVSQQRARFFSFRGDYDEAALEMKRALKRTAAVSGSKSQPTIQIMRELVNSLQMNSDSWPEEERLRLAVIEASTQSNGMGGSPMHDMNMLASRYFAVGQRENAVAWMDRSIALARKNPQAASMVQHFEQQRNHFADSQIQPQAGGLRINGGSPMRWFDASEASAQGSRLGGGPIPAGIIKLSTGSPVPPPPPLPN